MTKCCNTSEPTHVYPKKHVCPVNCQEYNEVPSSTVMHHISEPWRWQHKEQGYYFCNDPDCNVVYFGQDDSIIETSSLRTRVGIKEQSEMALICYCFGINKQQALKKPETKAFVIEQTQKQNCSCTTSNPSGRCCLKDFPKC